MLMRATVVYESMYGNTREIAQRVADGLRRHMEVEVFEVGEAPQELGGIDLLVVGAPTHAFGLGRAKARADLAEKEEIISGGVGVREWLEGVTVGSRSTAAAALTTIVDKPQWVRRLGTAGRVLDRRLEGLGLRLLCPAAGFEVAGMKGPLISGGAERAEAWGEELALLVEQRVTEPLSELV